MARVRIPVNVQQNGRLELTSAGDSSVEVVHLEPEECAVANDTRRVAHRSVVVIDIPSVQLQDETIGAPLAGVELWIPQTFVLASAMAAHAAEKPLVKTTGGLYVVAVDQGLGPHRSDYRRCARPARPARPELHRPRSEHLRVTELLFEAACWRCVARCVGVLCWR
jgi:hypothetical protein